MEQINLNLIPNGMQPICHCSQYDVGRVIRVNLFDGSVPYAIANGDTITLNVRKPDNTIVTTSLTATEGNSYVEIVTSQQMCACAGNNLCDLTITNSSVVIGTLNFIMQVERDVLADGIPSQSEIEDLDTRVQEAVEDNYYTKTETDDLLDAKADKSTTYTKTDIDKIATFNVVGTNLFNKNDTVNQHSNSYIEYDNGRIYTASGWTSALIPIQAGAKISTLGLNGGHIAFFSEINTNLNAITPPKNLNGYISGTTGQLTGYTVPANAVQMSISFMTANIDSVQVQYGETATEYEPYILKPAVLTDDIIKNSGLKTEIVNYIIKADGSGDFADLRACLESITDSSKEKQYIVNIYAGEYDIATLYSSYNVRGLTIPDYVTLRGIGDKHNVILKAVLNTQSTTFSLLNMLNVCGIENMTLYAKNCRYTVHDDYQSAKDTLNIRNIKDVIMIGELCGYGSVYGSGLKGNANWVFENCEFDATQASPDGLGGNSISNHNDIGVSTPSFITLKNCRMKNNRQTYNTLRFMSMTNGSANGTVTVHLYGNYIEGMTLGENNAAQYGAGICYWVNGFYNNLTSKGYAISNTDGQDYSANVDLI